MDNKTNEMPLIYTKYGNLPVADLTHQVAWEDTEDYTKLVETYLLKGEVVKQSVHVRTKKTVPIGTEIGAIG